MRYKIQLNLGRNCLRYIIKTYGIEEIFMPFYICPTVIRAVRKENCNIHFYHIDKNFMPVFNFGKNDFILYPNYFGICSKNVLKLSQKYKNLIVDNAHNPFMPEVGLADFKSYRKFFNVKDGAELNISKKFEIDFPKEEFIYEKFSTKLSYEELVENETRLDNEEILKISDCTKNLLSQIDFEKEKEKRLEKFQEFHKKYREKNELQFELSKFDVPFVYPYLTKDEKVGYELEKSGFLIIRYWESLPKDFPEYDFYKYLIPIPLN